MTDMLQKTENVANNVANKNSQDLTAQWKKGKLPEGWYYVIKTGDVEMLEYSCNCFLAVDVPLIDNEVTEVLAPVPSYEEWQASYNCMLENEVLRLKNAQLKERNDSLNNRDINLCRIANGIRDENYKLKNIITEMCCQLVDDDDDMSLGLAEYFDQDLLIKIREALK